MDCDWILKGKVVLDELYEFLRLFHGRCPAVRHGLAFEGKSGRLKYNCIRRNV